MTEFAPGRAPKSEKPGPITLFTKPGCHLCDDVLDLLLAVCDELGIETDIRAINILEDPELYARYRYTIPVVVVAGTTLMAPITGPDLRRALNQLTGRHDGPNRVQ